MDTWTPKLAEVDVSDKLECIKKNMPATYKNVGDKARKIGGLAYELVRRSLRGEPDCFFAVEAGYVMGTVFQDKQIRADLALMMVDFSPEAVVVWPANTFDEFRCVQCGQWVVRAQSQCACLGAKGAASGKN